MIGYGQVQAILGGNLDPMDPHEHVPDYEF